MRFSKKYVLLTVLLIAGLTLGIYFSLLPQAVKVAIPKKDSIIQRVSGPGNLEADVSVQVSPRISGIIEELKVKEGDTVSNDQVLAVLDDSDRSARVDVARSRLEEARLAVLTARAEKYRAKADLDLARWNYSRDRNLWQGEHIDKGTLEKSRTSLQVGRSKLQAANASLELNRQKLQSQKKELGYQEILLSFTRIKAPMDGRVVSREADEGETVSPDKTVYTMIDPETLEVAVRIDEAMSGAIRKGQEAEVRLRDNRTLPGVVSRIDPVSDPSTREITVYVTFRSLPQRFALEQEAIVTIKAGEKKGLALPVSCLIHKKGKPGVMVMKKGLAKFEAVDTGPSREGKVLILDGLGQGSRVILNPDKVEPGEKVRARDKV